MKENRIESFSELERSLNNLEQLSGEITATLNETNSIYEEQKNAWYSASSSQESQKMMNYTEEAKTIAKNIKEIKGAVERFKTNVHNIDENK